MQRLRGQNNLHLHFERGVNCFKLNGKRLDID